MSHSTPVTTAMPPVAQRRLSCPLCEAGDPPSAHRDRTREYYRCSGCALLFVPPWLYPEPAAERARYERHQNHPGDEGYRRFLKPLADEVVRRTEAGSRGLDFGCGPGPVLAEMLRGAGRSVELYDPYFAPDESIWSRTYDFITASEVFEHLQKPWWELDRLFGILRPGGWLAIMTQFVPPRDEWPKWHYFQDHTHVCFFSPATFVFIAEAFAAGLQLPGANLAILQKG